MKKRSSITVFLAIAISLFLILQYFGVTSSGFRIDFQTVRKGRWGRGEAGYYVIQSAEEWAEICVKVFPPDVTPPEVDFSTTTVIAVFMGEKPTSGYEIEVKEITDTIFRVVVKVAMITLVGKVVAGVFTAPFHIVKTEKTTKPITFQTIWETADC